MARKAKTRKGSRRKKIAGGLAAAAALSPWGIRAGRLAGGYAKLGGKAAVRGAKAAPGAAKSAYKSGKKKVKNAYHTARFLGVRNSLTLAGRKVKKGANRYVGR